MKITYFGHVLDMDCHCIMSGARYFTNREARVIPLTEKVHTERPRLK